MFLKPPVSSWKDQLTVPTPSIFADVLPTPETVGKDDFFEKGCVEADDNEDKEWETKTSPNVELHDEQLRTFFQ